MGLLIFKRLQPAEEPTPPTPSDCIVCLLNSSGSYIEFNRSDIQNEALSVPCRGHPGVWRPGVGYAGASRARQRRLRQPPRAGTGPAFDRHRKQHRRHAGAGRADLFGHGHRFGLVVLDPGRLRLGEDHDGDERFQHGAGSFRRGCGRVADSRGGQRRLDKPVWRLQFTRLPRNLRDPLRHRGVRGGLGDGERFAGRGASGGADAPDPDPLRDQPGRRRCRVGSGKSDGRPRSVCGLLIQFRLPHGVRRALELRQLALLQRRGAANRQPGGRPLPDPHHGGALFRARPIPHRRDGL